MNRCCAVLIGILVSASLCYGQASSVPGQAAPHVVAQGSFPVKVMKTLDSSKLKDGDAVQLETVGSFKLVDGSVVPKGTKVEAHVATAKARSKGDPESQLTLTFSKLQVAGKDVMINGAVQAVYPPVEEATPNMANAGTSQGGSGAGAGSGGVGITNANNGSNMETSNAQGVMNLKATGVQGIHGLSLDNGAITSKGKNIKLGGGVRMVVHADFLEQAQKL